ncbi:MAG: substrate-binding domain-containing protein [Bryobacteraceae bacterium]
MAVTSHLAAIRHERGVAAADLAKRAGVSRQTIYAIESGSYVPNTTLALRLARELAVSVEDLFSLSEAGVHTEETVRATLLSSSQEEANRGVRLARLKDRWVAASVDSVPHYLPDADGIVTHPARGPSEASVHLIGAAETLSKRLFIAGCDPALGWLARMAEKLSGVEIVTVPASSRRALEWLKRGLVHIAGSHLEDPHSGEFNLPFLRRLMPREDLAVVTFARWEEGFVVARGNPFGIRQAGDLVHPRIRLINRETGSGSRALLESLLGKAGIPYGKVKGYDQVASGHLDAALAVASGAADCCVATPSAARAFGLDFIPLHGERFDFAVRREFLDHAGVRCILDALQRATLRRKLESLAGYDTSETGRVLA